MSHIDLPPGAFKNRMTLGGYRCQPKSVPPSIVGIGISIYATVSSTPTPIIGLRKISMRILLSIALVVSIAACTTVPSLQEGPDAEVSFDGLVGINNSVFQRAWIDPDIDLSVYNKIMPGGAEFEFRAVRGSAGTSMSTSSRTEFQISEENQQRLIDTVGEIFREELSKSQFFTMTDERGPDVLIIKGALLDIVSRVPPERVGRAVRPAGSRPSTATRAKGSRPAPCSSRVRARCRATDSSAAAPWHPG